MQQRIQVEVHTALNEEHRDQEAEADGLELAGHGCVVVSRDEQSYDHAGGEGAEEDVEAQLERQVHEQHDEQDGDPDRELRSGVQVPPEQTDEARRVDLGGERRGHDGDHDEESEEEEGDAGVPVGQEKRDGDDGAEFADRTDREDDRPDRGAKYPGISQHGEQGAQRGGRQAQRGDDGVDDESGRVQGGSEGDGDGQGGQPGRDRQAGTALLQDGGVELRPGEEHQEGQSEVGQRGHDGFRMDDGQDIGTHDDAQDDLDHDLGQFDVATKQLRDDRSGDCHRGDDHQCGYRIATHGLPRLPLSRTARASGHHATAIVPATGGSPVAVVSVVVDGLGAAV